MSYLPPPAPGTGPYAGPPPKLPKPVLPDPLAVALANASLLGIGYVLMRRWILAIAAVLVTTALVVVLALRKEIWCEVALAVWWVVPIVHGWFLAHRQPQRTASLGKRLIALGIAVPVLLAVGFVRYDAARIAGDVTEAREAGDCAQVVTAQDKVWSGHRVLDGRETDRGDDDVEACDRLDTAAATLRTARLKGDPKALDEGFGILSDVLADPGQEQTVGVVLDEFLRGLPTKDAYRATLIVCTEENDYGPAVETCPYPPRGVPNGASTDVTFYKIAVPVKAYELRTGRLVVSTTVQISGASCPQTIFTSYTPSSEYVEPTSANVQTAFRPVVVRP